ncbi:hypothetical protein [Streptomyces sp. NPDC047061]|uniref:TRADD-N-associated membrane domain-containing protein n=1 Tax=Streptomyces sp. NPDC047061 TaxID=3154605 RepID=UPI0034080AA7
MKSTIRDIRPATLAIDLECDMHPEHGDDCSRLVVAQVLMDHDDDLAKVSIMDACQRWLDTDPDAIEWQRRQVQGDARLNLNASLSASGVVVTGGNVNIGQVGGDVAGAVSLGSSLAEQRQKFHFDFLSHTLKQAEWTFRLSVWFMTGGAIVILAGAVLALVHAGNPDLSYLPLVTSLTGALITVGGGALALHSKRTMANLTKAAEDNESKIDIDHKLEVATTFIDRVGNSETKDRLNSAAAMKALGMEAAPETMVERLLPEKAKEIEPGDSAR